MKEVRIDVQKDLREALVFKKGGNMEKLTKSGIAHLCSIETEGWFDRVDKIWSAIESDREAIREETRAEILKDHFKIGEKVEFHDFGSWPEAIVSLYKKNGGNCWGDFKVRRPRIMRTRSQAEIRAEINRYFGANVTMRLLDQTILYIAANLNIPTEVPE